MSRNITEFLNSKKEQVELSSQKIELGLIQDVTKAYDKADASSKSARGAISSVFSDLSSASKQFSDIAKSIQQGKATAKELGADDVLKKLEGYEANVNERVKRLNSADKALQSAMNSI